MKRVRILLADDHQVVLEGLRRILDRPEFEVVGTAMDGRELVEAARKLQPDLILADVSMPLLSGIQAVREILRTQEKAKVIFLTMHPEVPYAVEALAVGASGYVLKNSAGDELLTAIQEVLQGRTYLAATIRERVSDALVARSHKARGAGEMLTPRQREVLRLLAQGLQVKEVAAQLNVTPKTVEFHKQQMKRALGVQTVAELAVYAAKHGITE
jgi:DNA-binding NarL/FixJ family response regulator